MIHHSHPQYDVHFFGKDITFDVLEKSFTHLCYLKQVHGIAIVEAQYESATADAHWTKDKKKSLVIQTADCLPIMIFLPQQKISLAIHAGWRGIQKKIVSQSLTALAVKKFDPIHLFIGPHIQQKSFEVDKDVAVDILSAHELDLNYEHCLEKDAKYYLNLSQIIVREVEALKLQIDVLNISDIDTKTNENYNSYRSGDHGGRNYSVISLK